MLHCTAVSQFQPHTQLHYKCCTVLQYPSFSTTQSYTTNVALYCSIPVSAPHTATPQVLHCTAVSQFQHHTQLHSKCCTVLQYHSFSTTHSYAPNVALYCSITVSAPHTATPQMLHCTCFFVTYNSNLLVKKQILLLLNAVFAMALPHLISHVNLAPSVIMVPKQFQYSTLSACCHNLHCHMLAFRFSLLQIFPHSFPFHSIFQFRSVYQSCPRSTLSTLASSTMLSAYFAV